MLALSIKAWSLPETYQLIWLPLQGTEYCKQTNCKCSENNNVRKGGWLVFIKAVSVFIRNLYELTQIIIIINLSLRFIKPVLHSSAQMQQLNFWHHVTIFKVASDWKIQLILQELWKLLTDTRKDLSFEKGPPGIFCIWLPRKEVYKAVCFLLWPVSTKNVLTFDGLLTNTKIDWDVWMSTTKTHRKQKLWAKFVISYNRMTLSQLWTAR